MNKVIALVGIFLLILALVFYFTNVAAGSVTFLTIVGALVVAVSFLARENKL